MEKRLWVNQRKESKLDKYTFPGISICLNSGCLGHCVFLSHIPDFFLLGPNIMNKEIKEVPKGTKALGYSRQC